MRDIFIKVIQSLIEFVLPPRNTEKIVQNLTLSFLTGIARPNGALPYKNKDVRALVWEFKYRANSKAVSLAANILYDRVLEITEEELSSPLLIPVPMHTKRRKVRGYNQTELLCREVVRQSRGSFKYEPTLLSRVRNTPTQQGLPRHKRLHNVADSMEASNTELLLGKTCIVIDDVSTTGATLAEARRALLQGGAARVYSLSLAE